MTRGLEPTEETDGRITVRLLRDAGENRVIRCGSYEAAIETVRERADAVAAAKIVDRDGDVVFTSAEMDVDAWERDWERQKRHLSVSVDERECPYDDRACFADDPCVRCELDAMQARYRGT